MMGRRCDLKGTCSPDSSLSSWSEEIDTCVETRLALRNKGANILTYSLSSLDLLTYLVIFGMLTLTWNISQIGFISLYPLGKEPIENICISICNSDFSASGGSWQQLEASDWCEG